MKHRAIIFLAIGIGILLAMILYIGPGKIESAISMADLWYVMLAILIQFAVYGLLTYRWSITTNSVGISVGKLHLFPMVMVGLAINNLTPSARGGGEPVRAYILAKYSRSPLEKTFATVIADRGLDTFPFIVLAILTIISMVLYFHLSEWIVYTLIFSVIIIIIIFSLAVYISVNQRAAIKVTRWILGIIKIFSKGGYNKIEKKVRKAIHGFQNSMRVMLNDRKVLAYGIPLSFLIWFFDIIRVYIVFSAFDVDVSLIVIAQVFIIASLISLIPLIPGGLGAVDGMMIVLYSFAGVPPSISAAATILERLISFWMTSVIGIAFLPYFGANVVEKFFKSFKNQ